jgi:hypothetical protein
MPFASPPSSSWQLFCLLMPLLFIALKLHSDQQQRIQPLPVFWLACEGVSFFSGLALAANKSAVIFFAQHASREKAALVRIEGWHKQGCCRTERSEPRQS